MEQTAQELTLTNAVERLIVSVNKLQERVIESRPEKETAIGGSNGSNESKVRHLAQSIMNQSERIDTIVKNLPI